MENDNNINQEQQNNTINKPLNNKGKVSASSIIGLILGLIPIALFAYCVIISIPAKSNEGTAFWVVIIYFWTIGIPIAISSLIASINGFTQKRNALSITALVVSLITVLPLTFLILFLIFQP